VNIRHSDAEKVPLWTGHGYDHRGYRIRAPGPVNRVLPSESPTIDALYEMLAGTEVAALLLMWGVIIAAAIPRAFTGFGFALAAVPVFSLFMPPTQAVVLTASLALAISLLSIRTYWGRYPLGAMAPMFLMSLVGTGTGVLLLTSISGQRFQLYIGIAVILACAILTFYRPGKAQPGPGLGGMAGLLSGLLNGAFAIPGPPVIVYAMATEPDPSRSRALLLTFFLFSSTVALAAYTAAGFVTPLSPWLFLLAFPAMYVGDKVGYHLFHRFGTALYRRVALAVLFSVGVGITLRALA
jgi:uncharacterized membrane protein YfcA